MGRLGFVETSTANGRGSSIFAALDERLNKPYYVFRPDQALRRLTLGRRRHQPGGYQEIKSPWGLPLKFRADEHTGLSYARRGVFDLSVCEVLWRLLDPGEDAVDVGANIGQMTGLMAAAVGRGGRVIAFEPHPDVFRELTENARRWEDLKAVGSIDLRQLAASSVAGVADLGESEAFERNIGTASIGRDTEALVASIRVPTATLDQQLGDGAVGVMKLDVEGHELEVLRGATQHLRQRRIRDIVFEELGDPPTPVMNLLRGFEYSVFSLDQALLGPTIGPATDRSARRSRDDPSYLATVDPGRALDRIKARGWGLLGFGRYRRGTGTSDIAKSR